MISLYRQALLRHVNPTPPRWQVAFGRAVALEVDLGCGRGVYPLERARRFPQVDVVALETKRHWIEWLRRQAAGAQVRNLRAIRCDVTEDLPVLFAPGTVSLFTVHHPDPWWKKKHRRRRMLQPSMVEKLSDLLRPGGCIFLQTDVPDLAEQMNAALAACPALRQLDAQHFWQGTLGGLLSHRGRKCLDRGIPVMRLSYQRSES